MSRISRQAKSRWNKLWDFFTKTPASGASKDVQGTSNGAGFSSQFHQDYRLDIPDTPLRPVMGSLEYSRDLLEIMEWSPEARTALSFLSRDPFMEREGRVGSWQVGTSVDGDTPVNDKILGISKELRTRRYGKHLVLGGLRLKNAAREALGLGDSFLQICIEKEGISRNRYCISRSLYMPPLSMFVDEDEVGGERGYHQSFADADDVEFNPLKILHFSYEKRRLYGESSLFQSIPSWRKIKRTSPATEKVITQAGVAPWIHTMSQTATERDRENYRRRHQSERAEGFLSDIYLPHGASVRKAEGNVSGITETVNYEQNLLRRMIPLGLPPYFFPGLSDSSGKERELSGQPAMLYARTIADIRAFLGDQIRWALDIEIVLTYGFDFLTQNPYDIVWPKWEVLPPNQMSESYQKVETEEPEGADAKDQEDKKSDRAKLRLAS